MSGDACRGKNRKPEARYGNPEVAHNSECDASSELTSEGESDGEVEVRETPGSSGRRSATLNRTFLVPGGTDVAEASPAVVMRTRHRIKPQRPLSFSGLSGTLAALSNSGDGASARWAASETALNHLMSSSPALSPCLAGSRPLMCHASTQKDRLSPSTEGLGSSLAGLSSSGSASAGGVRQRRRRHSARLRNMKSISRRSEHDAQIVQSNESNNNMTLQTRLSVSAASASSSGEGSSVGAGSQRSRRIVKSSTLTRIVDASAPLPIIAGPVANTQSSPLKPMPPPSTNSSPRSAPSDGELGLAHVDETSNFSEQAWDNYVVILFLFIDHFRSFFELTVFGVFRIAMPVRLTVKILRMLKVLVDYWNLVKITAMTWTACRIALQALAPTCVLSARTTCPSALLPNDPKDSEWRIVRRWLNCASWIPILM